MKLFSYVQAAEFLKVKIGTLYSLVATHRIPYVKIGPRFIRFEEEKLIEWVAEKRKMDTSLPSQKVEVRK